MRKMTVSMVAVGSVAIGLFGAAAPVTAGSTDVGFRPQCPGGQTDIGNGQGSYYCVPSDNIHCPGSFNDANGNGSLDYGECFVGGSSATQPATTRPAATQPPQTQPPQTQPPQNRPPSGQPQQPAATDPEQAAPPAGESPASDEAETEAAPEEAESTTFAATLDAACPTGTGQSLLAAAVAEATGADGSERAVEIVTRCDVVFSGAVVPELGRPTTNIEMLITDPNNNVTPNQAQLDLINAELALYWRILQAWEGAAPGTASATSTTVG